MSEDPYQVLGLARDASPEDIRRAYRRLAKQHHPDLNPGDRKAEEEFKKISSAYDLLSDPEKRARYDRGEIDASGQERPQRSYYRYYADREQASPYHSQAGFADFEEVGDIFSDLFGNRRRSGGAQFQARGADIRYEMTVDFLDAVNGAKKRVTMPDGRSLDLTIPPGLQDGQTLRLKGQGMPGIGGGPPGDALVTIHVKEHPLFEREGDAIHVDVPVSLSEAVLGGRIRVPTPTGPVQVTVPKGSNTGTVLRLRGKGVPRPGGGHGDEYVHLRVVLPKQPDSELEAFLREWGQKHAYDPRHDMGA